MNGSNYIDKIPDIVEAMQERIYKDCRYVLNDENVKSAVLQIIEAMSETASADEQMTIRIGLNGAERKEYLAGIDIKKEAIWGIYRTVSRQ